MGLFMVEKKISVVSGSLILLAQNSIVQASSELGVDGRIDVTEPNREIVGQLAVLPTNYVDASSLLTTPCEERTERAGSFVIQRRGSVGSQLDGPLSAELLRGSEASPSADDSSCAPREEYR